MPTMRFTGRSSCGACEGLGARPYATRQMPARSHEPVTARSPFAGRHRCPGPRGCAQPDGRVEGETRMELSIQAVLVSVSDLERSIQFYREVFDLKVVSQGDR